MKSRVLPSILVAIVVAAALFLAARPIVLAVDRVATDRMLSATATPIGWNGSTLFIGSRTSDLAAPDFTPAVRLQVDARGQLVASAGGKDFVLGIRDGVLSGGGGNDVPAFVAEPGDEAMFTVERSWLAWPTPFDLNFMTGHSPSWRRGLYDRLVWTKRSGARLEMLWRYEEYFYPNHGWTGAYMTRADWSGLALVEIRQSAGVAAAPSR